MRRFSDDPDLDRKIRQAVNGAADTSVKLKGLATADLPAAEDHRHGFIADTTTGKPKFSNGTDWFQLSTTDHAHAASAITNTPAGNIAATTVQAAINELDVEKASYATGTFTPNLLFGGANVGMTYGIQAGRYTKVGRVVHADIFISLSAVGSSTGTATISGLPFSALGTAPPSPGIIVPSGLVTVTCPMCRVYNGTVIDLYDFTGSTTAVLTHADFQAGSDMQIHLTYHTT